MQLCHFVGKYSYEKQFNNTNPKKLARTEI